MWTPSAVAALAVLAALAPTPRRALAPAIAAAVLAGHAVLASLARPANTAAVLGALVVVGVGAAALSRRDVTSAPRRAVGGAALLIGLLALAPAVGAALVAGHLPSWWVARLTCGSVLLVLAGLVAVRRRWPQLRWYAFAAVLGSAALWPTVAALSGTDPIGRDLAHEPLAGSADHIRTLGVYAGVGLVLIAAALLPMRGAEELSLACAAPAAIPAALLFAVDVVPAVLTVLALPYAWFGSIWSGRPPGVGLAPAGTVNGSAARNDPGNFDRLCRRGGRDPRGGPCSCWPSPRPRWPTPCAGGSAPPSADSASADPPPSSWRWSRQPRGGRSYRQ